MPIFTNFSDFSPKLFGPKLAKTKIVLSKMGMGKKLYFKFFFSFIIEKNLLVQWFPFRKWRFMIFLSGATEMDFFENSSWNYMKIASKPHIPFLWRIFLRLHSPSSFGAAYQNYFLKAFGQYNPYKPYKNIKTTNSKN